MQDSAKSADEVLNSLIKYAKGQGEKGVNNLQKIKDYLGEENNAFLEMQILNKLFKESVVENDRAGVRVFDSESFLSRVRELVGENELYERKIGKEFLEELSPSAMPKQISIDEFLNTLENFKNKENFLKHIEKDPKRKDYLNLIEPTLKEPDIAFKKLENGVEKEKFIKKFSDGKDFFYLLATKDNKETILTAFKTDKINTILKEFNTDIIPTFIRQGSKGKAAGTTNEGIITQPLFKSKEAREFLELVEGFHKLYKNDASIAKNLVQGTASQLSTSIATSAEGAIKQKVVKGGFDPIFRLLPDGILFGLFSKQIQGGALRYHLKKALSRSLNYDDFKIKLEKELKRTNFNSNTSRLIDEFMQNLEDFNREKEQFLEAKRIEQARIKEEEQARINTIKTAQENAYNAQEANLGNDILEPSSLKEDFGENFAGYKGKEAIEKLLEEQRGQVKGAFYKEGLGEIDLVWGEITDLEKHKGYGLAHILDKRKSEFVEQGASQSEAAQKAAEFAKNEISNIMQNGKIINKANEATRIETQDYRLILKQNWKGEPTKNKWLVTAYMKKEKGESISSSPFTKEDNLSLNSNESIAQNALSADEAISILQSAQAKQVPKELDIEGFLKELESVENKENFISHLSKKEDAKSRLAYLNLVKPTLEEADLILKTKNKNDEPTKEFIKAFQDENKRFFYIVITEQDNEKKLLTAFKTNKLRELKNRIEKARDFGEISFAHRFIKKSPTAENILKQKSLNLTEKLYLKDNDTPLNVEYKIVNKDDIKPTFTLSKTQFRSQKQEDLIKKIKENFNPDLLVNIRGDLKKGNPIITQNGEVLSGNHRADALKELEGENLAKYQNAVKEAFGVELKENEMLVRVADTSEAEIRRFSAASNEGLENNLGEQGVSLFAKYQDKIKALKEAKKPFVADDVYNLKYLVNKALGESSITKENDTSKALFASLARGRNNTILKALNELEKENLEQVSKVANMFFDNAGAFYNLTHDLDLPKMQNLQNYFSDVLVSVAKADFTRAEDFTRLNEDIRAFLDSGDKNAMLKLSPNLVSDLLAKAMGAGFARFARLENPSASLYEFLNGLKAELIEKGMPDLFSGGKGIKLNERDEFDFAKELILKGQDSEEKFRLYQNLEELKAWKSKSSLNQPTKESLDKDLNKSYTLELENLEPVSLNANALSKETEALTQSVESGHKQSTTIAKTDEESIAENAKSERAEFESFKDKIKELYTKYEGLNHYDKSASHLKSKLLNQEIKPEIKKEFKSIIDKFKGADNKDKMLRVIKENKEELSDYLAFNIALRKDIYIDGYGVGKYDFYDKLIRNFFKLRENKQWSEIDESKYRALAALENLSNKNTSLYFSFKGLNGKVGEIKTYPRIQDLLFYDLILGYDLKNAVILSTKDKLLKEKLIEKLKAYIDKKIYADFLEYKIKDLESRNPKNSHFENYKDEKWDEEALKSFKKELEDLRANEKGTKLEAKGSEDIIFTDKKGKEHTLTKETQKAWLEAFGLKSLEEAYIPNFKAEVKEAINRVLGGEEIKLTKGSLIKLIKEKRLKYLDRIKPTLENPHSVILQNDGALIFARDYGEEKYFTSVARNDSGEWIIRSNAPKSKNGLNNKILNGGKEIYNDQAASQINASNPYDDIANSNIKLDNESIAQNGIKDNKQAFLQFIKIMQDTKNGDFYPSENLQNALEKSGKKARENAL
ncbi:PBECR2 nuclease fold domain-containing protein, partial [Campylobacter upsaliensis]|uniref:putative barnase/colicin E5 family endoribonuclease n=1 Tax=Campylobacter upsaliensis TaxID=28080 RepID=UPI0022EB537C